MRRYLCPERVFVEGRFRSDLAVVLADGIIESVLPVESLPSDVAREVLAGSLAPGFIDLQVNGGGDLLFNDEPSVEGLRHMAAAHAGLGTTGFLPTVITDRPAVLTAALQAVERASGKVPGILGLHVEGPFIEPAKSGVHDTRQIRQMDEATLEALSGFRAGRLLITLAPECVAPGTIRRLVDAGATVAAGHTNATFEQLQAAMDEGLSGFTHLFNAMSQLTAREPGAVGAALAAGSAWASIIVDGHHVHPAVMRVAYSCLGPERLVLVSDAMPPVGGQSTRFMLQGREITVESGHCVSAEGKLAGAAIALADAVREAHRFMGVTIDQAVQMATESPARALGLDGGRVAAGQPADLVLLNDRFEVVATWVAGQPVLPLT
ncbi:MAG: N-acetylglucosamine-6-phosphate deacetylase [Steroidobacteraceae bacterium]